MTEMNPSKCGLIKWFQLGKYRIQLLKQFPYSSNYDPIPLVEWKSILLMEILLRKNKS